jgi:SAM-dependent methyltransferase
VISTRLMSLVRCPECHGTLNHSSPRLTCRSCGRTYGPASGDFLDLRPQVAFEERTKYLDEALHADARHERVSPPLLGSKIRNDMLRRFLAPTSSDLVADLGCGSGRALMWNRDWGSTNVGIDIAPFFAHDARQQVDLVIGDLRRLPFADASFTKAFSLDVLEHLSPEALRAMLREAARVIAPGGSLFVYTHVRKNARIAAGLRWVNALARQLDRADLIDLRQEHLRKSDHLNPLADIPELRRVAAETGFHVARIRYYTPIVGGFIENILVRIAERQMARRAAGRLASKMDAASADRQAIKEARREAKERIAASRTTRAVFRALTAAMKLDLLLFGSIESGPFFALLERVGPRTSDPAPRTSAFAPRTSHAEKS